LRQSPLRTAALLAAHRANAQGPCHGPGRGSSGFERPPARRSHRPLAGKASGGGRPGWPSSVPLVPRGNYRHLWDGQADQVAGAGGAGRERGLTSKAGMSFSFMGIMLATPPSIKDSDRGRAAEGGADVLGAAASLLDPARREQVRMMGGEDLLGSPPRGSWQEHCWRRQRFRSHQPSVSHFPGLAAVTGLRAPATQGRVRLLRWTATLWALPWTPQPWRGLRTNPEYAVKSTDRFLTLYPGFRWRSRTKGRCRC
jgi:hypothetical protein